jgi:hypothetical protein
MTSDVSDVPEAAVSNRSKTVTLFDHLVGASEQSRRDGDTESFPATGSNLSTQPNTKANHTL